jgi:hypothetical protein
MWYAYVAFFFAGCFLTNGVPHFVNGISGKPFQSPFASPPGVGLSSPLTNVLWGLFNFVIGALLILWMTSWRTYVESPTVSAVVAFIGVLVTAVGLAVHFGRVRNG